MRPFRLCRKRLKSYKYAPSLATHSRRLYTIQCLRVIDYTDPKVTFRMTSLYHQTIPVFTKYLNNLSGIIAKGEKWVKDGNKTEEELLSFRLHPEMRGVRLSVSATRPLHTKRSRRTGNR